MTLRACLSTAAIALAAIAATQQPKVTLTSVATKTSTVAAEIKRQTGVNIVCNPTVADIPILVHVNDVPLDVLLQKIATATGGEVIAQGEGFLLSKSDKLRTEQANKENGWVIAAFDRAKSKTTASTTPDRWDKKTLDDLIAKANDAREKMAQRMTGIQLGAGQTITMFDSSMNSSTPSSGSAKRALELIPSSTLASIKPGDRIVYSTMPNRMQRRIPFNVTPIVNDFVYNHNLLANAAPQLKNPPNVNVVGGLSAGDPIQGVVETHVVLSRGWRSSTVQVEIKFVDRNGVFVGQGSTSITPDYTPVQPATSEEGKQIELSELSRQMAVIMAQELAQPTSDRTMYRVATNDGGAGGALIAITGGSDTLPKQFPDELLNVFVNPDKYDPASLYVSECYIQAARAEGKNIIATFPDSIVRDLARILVKGNVTHKAILASAPAQGVQIVDENGWLTVTPTWANSARETRFNRTEAAQLYRAVNGRGFATLEEMADYAFYLTTGMSEKTLDMVYLTLINKDAGDLFNEYTSFNFDLLRLYGTIPENAKRQAGEVLKLQYRQLSPVGKQLADHAFYSRQTGFAMPEPAVGAFSAMILTQPGVDSNGRPVIANSIMSEPTEALPNGLPAEALINVTRAIREGVFGSTKGIRGGLLLTAEELGMRQHMLEANTGGGLGQIPAYDSFRPAQVMVVGITLDLGDYGRPSAYFKDGWIDANSRSMTYNQLPDGFREQVERARQNIGRPVTLPDGVPPPAGGTRVRGGGGG